ncbi:MAG: peptidylprolyl isomerase [Bacteroidota bacterium]
MMTKMRESTGVVLWILVLSFGGLWVLQDSGALDNIGIQQRQNIAVVNGEPVLYEEYTRALEQEVRNYRQQTGQSATQALRDQYSDAVYDRLVEDRLREREMDRLGIRVTDAEVENLFTGPSPDPVVLQLFAGQDGELDRGLLQSAIDNPEATQDLIAIEEYLRGKRRAEKLNALFGAAVRVSDAEVDAEYVRRNRTAQGRYVALRYAEIPDSAVAATDRDFRAYYDANRDDFARERTVYVDFVTLSQEPSAEDSAAIMSDLGDLRAAFAAAEDDSLFVLQNFSQTPFDGLYAGPSGMEAEIAEAVFADPTEGRVVGPVLVGDQARLVKIADVREADEVAVRARHILFGNRGDTDAQREAQRQQALDVKRQLDGGASFETLARQYSQDPGSAARGGDLGWFGQGRMVPPFEEAAFGARTGEVVGPVATDFGFHLIRVEDRTNAEVRLAQLSQSVGITSATLRAVRDQADDLTYYTEEGGDFAGEAERLGLELQQAVVQGDQAFIPGLGNSRAVRSFVARAEPGDVSDVIDTGTAFVVVRVTDVEAEGFRPFEDVRAEVEPRVRLEQKKEVQAAKLRDASGSLEEIGAAVGAPVRTAQNLALSATTVPGLGREPAFVGTLLGLDEGETSGVVTGENAAFVITSTGVTEVDPASMTAEERTTLRSELLNQRRQRIQQQWLERLRDEADIEDNRSLFF